MSLAGDHIRRLWNFTLRTEDETFDTFRHWKALIENQKGSKVKALRIDNGLEFFNEHFENYCKDQGLSRYRIVVRISQQMA